MNEFGIEGVGFDDSLKKVTVQNPSPSTASRSALANNVQPPPVISALASQGIRETRTENPMLGPKVQFFRRRSHDTAHFFKGLDRIGGMLRERK